MLVNIGGYFKTRPGRLKTKPARSNSDLVLTLVLTLFGDRPDIACVSDVVAEFCAGAVVGGVRSFRR